MKLEQVTSMGMPLDNWTHKSCEAMIGTGDDWATIYMISSNEKGKGHASELLAEIKSGIHKQFVYDSEKQRV